MKKEIQPCCRSPRHLTLEWQDLLLSQQRFWRPESRCLWLQAIPPNYRQPKRQFVIFTFVRSLDLWSVSHIINLGGREECQTGIKSLIRREEKWITLIGETLFSVFCFSTTSQTLEVLFWADTCPSRALNMDAYFYSELQKYKNTVRCGKL